MASSLVDIFFTELMMDGVHWFILYLGRAHSFPTSHTSIRSFHSS